MNLRIALALALSVSATTAFAQDQAAAPVPAPAPVEAAPPPVQRTLPASTLLSLTPDAEISSKKVEVGDTVSFSVVNDVTDNGVVAIPRGSHVDGTISWKTGKAVGGKSGKFEVNFDRVTVGERSYALRGRHRQEGKGNTVAAVFATWLVSGRSAQMLPGQFVNAFTAEAIPY